MSAGPAGVLIVVDGYSSGAQLPATLAEHGWDCIHVRSRATPSPYFLNSYKEDDYIANFTLDGDIDRLAEVLRPYRPDAVLPGAEGGVIVADALARALELPGNDPSTSAARRDKYVMHNRLKACNLRSMDHFLAGDFASLRDWAAKGDWPVVLKPRDSVGTDSVIFCDDERELKHAFDGIFDTANQLGGHNDTVLAQRLLVGEEYFVNGVSAQGRHVITEIWRADKLAGPNGGWIYDRAVLFDPATPEMAEIVAYVKAVLDALGMRYGANHTELMMTEAGPTLIESASRLSGGLHRPAANYAVGASQLDLVARLVSEGPSAIHDIEAMAGKGHRHPLWQVQFISNQEGVVTRSSFDELVQALECRAWLQRWPRVGDRVMKTVDLLSSPGIVFMSHQDVAVLEKSYRTVREWEESARLFSVE